MMIAAILVLGGVCCAHGETTTAADKTGPHTVMWGGLLSDTVVQGHVDYRSMKRRGNELDSYLAFLADVDVEKLTRNEELAFWINAYNAFTVKLILEHYPVKTIRDIPRPWKSKRWLVGGTKRSLDEMEHTFLREKLQEPRIHFAIVCASIGCPDLWNRAYTAERIETQLDAAARRFVQSDRHVRTTTRKGLFGRRVRVLEVSSIFKWFEDDFTRGETQRVAEYVARYATKATRDVIAAAGDRLETEYVPYDWGLNGR